MNLNVRADLVANVLSVRVEVGSQVEAGEVLLLLESMKMEIPVIAEVDATVTAVRVQPGMVVQDGDVLVTLEPR